MQVAIRVDGGGWRGLGHVSRMVALAPELQRLGAHVVYATRTADMLPRLARIAPSKLLVGASDHDALAALSVDRVVVDLPYRVCTDGLPRPYDVPRSHAGDMTRAILRREFRAAHEAPRTLPGGKPRCYVSGGGTDGHGLLVPLLEAVGLMREDVEPVVADGSIEDVARTMAGCTLALISYGVTALECACVGLPALYLCATDAHEVGAKALAAHGCGINLGVRGRVSEHAIAAKADVLLRAPRTLDAMTAAGRALVDGLGAVRVAEEIVGG